MAKERNDGWASDLRTWTMWAASSVDDIADAGLRRLKKRFGRSGIPKIQPYIGYATRDTVRLHGRVLTNPPLDPDFSNDRWWQNLTNSIQRFASDEVVGAPVVARVGRTTGHTTSDAEGYFHLDMPRDASIVGNLFWSSAELQVVDGDSMNQAESATSCDVMCVPAAADYGIISDVDDTILHTGATDIATMAKLTFFGNARTRAPLDGVAKLYELMQCSGKPTEFPINPIFYISSSPWNLYDLLEDFLELNAIPKGPLLLRDLGFDENKFLKGGHDHKLIKARNLMNRYDRLPFVLFGDSGQEDARLYAAAAEEFGSRIKAIFIRDIDPDMTSDHDIKVEAYVHRSEAAGVPMHLVEDSVEVAHLAQRYGLLPAHAIEAILAATQKDQKRKRDFAELAS